MRVGAFLPTYWTDYGTTTVREAVEEAARAAEALGYASVWANDHVIAPAHQAGVGHIIEPLMTLASLIHLVPRLQLGTSALVLPQRHAVVVAKQVAALDVLSGGRFILGVGVGWLEEEFGFLNADFARRGAVTDEAIRAMRALWSEPVASFHGRFYAFSDAVFFPKPRSGGVPVWVCGNTRPAIRRAGLDRDAVTTATALLSYHLPALAGRGIGSSLHAHSCQRLAVSRNTSRGTAEGCGGPDETDGQDGPVHAAFAVRGPDAVTGNRGKRECVTDANWRVGIDVGGTFTDVCLFEEETGALRVAKVPSTPDNPSRAITTGLERILQDGGRQGEVAYFGHGSTVATNALIEGRGVPTGLITTAGFRDLLELGRNRRPDLYDLQVDKPEPLVRRDKRLEVRERVHFDGTVESPLDEEDVRTVVRRLRTMGVEAVAICFLYSYVRPEHEQVVQRILAEEFPEAFVSASHEVLPEFREYERLSTVVTNAYLGPVMSTYLTSLEPQLRAQGVRVPGHITQSNGGVISFEVAEREPVRTILSGPSTGVVGATYVARRAGYDNIITFDMGGTSTDVSLIERGRPRLASEMDLQGYPIKTPMLDINTIGAGGGSIAWLDSGGHLKVGPRSAGAV